MIYDTTISFWVTVYFDATRMTQHVSEFYF